MKITVMSVFDPRRRVELDPYGPNPLEEDMKGSPAYAMAVKYEPPPKMFQGGTADLPVFTASGIDPKMLLQVPYTMRHYLAAAPNVAAVHGIFEQYSTEPDYVLPHAGLDDAIRRMSHWAKTAGINPVEEAQAARESQSDTRRANDLAALSPARRAAILSAATVGGAA